MASRDTDVAALVGNITSSPSNTTSSPSNTTSSPSSTTSEEYEDDLWAWRVGLYGVGGLVVACVGIVGNIISMVVLAHYKKKTNAPFLLICLSVFDTIFLVSEAILENLLYMANGGVISDTYRQGFFKPLYGNMYPLPRVSQICVVYTVIAITTERYIAVVWPFRAYFLCRRVTVVSAVLVIVASSILYHIPIYMAYEYEYVWNNDTNKRVFRFYRTQFGQGHFYNYVYNSWMNLTVLFVVPFVLLLVLNSHMMLALRRSKSVVKTKTRKSQDDRLTIMVVSMTVIFFFCSLFPAVALILTTGMNSYTQCDSFCNRFSAVADLMRMVNSAINFAIYCAAGKNFRDVFKEVFCHKLPCRLWKKEGKFLSGTQHSNPSNGIWTTTNTRTSSMQDINTVGPGCCDHSMSELE